MCLQDNNSCCFNAVILWCFIPFLSSVNKIGDRLLDNLLFALFLLPYFSGTIQSGVFCFLLAARQRRIALPLREIQVRSVLRKRHFDFAAVVDYVALQDFLGDIVFELALNRTL